MSPDRAARLIAIHSFLYYGCSHNIIADHEFDRLCLNAAKHWDDLSPLRRWQLGAPEAVSASGFHVKITLAGIGATERLLKKRIAHPKLHFSEEHRVHWLEVGEKSDITEIPYEQARSRPRVGHDRHDRKR